MSARFLVTTRATGGTCPDCHRPVLRGLAEGRPAQVDIAHLAPPAEVAALLNHRATYTLLRSTGELIHRDAGRIRGGRLRGPVLGQHTCQPAQPALFDTLEAS